MHRKSLIYIAAGVVIVAALAVLLTLPAQDVPLITAAPAPAPALSPSSPPDPRTGCLPSGDGFFRARLDGELQMRIDWADEQIDCEGMARPGGDGIRLSFRGVHGKDKPLLIVLGIAGLSESTTGNALPANVTIIEEAASRVFGTLGDDKCTVDELRQELVAPWRADARRYRVTGRGFCTAPALAVGGERSVLMSTFDFAGQVVYDSDAAPGRKDGAA